ncbi:MAG TPA: hypothetical protein VFA77_13945, partial [Candidatus Eisenbacteria bacterium]|nr:hypothetical protein [Candidatus Eisenbacteria bacterium]
MRRVLTAGFGRRANGRVLLVLALASLAAILGAVVRWKGPARVVDRASDSYTKRPAGTITFATDIAPIIYRRCSVCHRPGQAAPFSLLTYAEVKKRASQVIEVTERRYMPPWLPTHGLVEYAEERMLTVEELGLLRQWFDEGASEGDPARLPSAPQWTEGWQLGKPDLVVRMPAPYILNPEGKDVYRNIVLPIPLELARYVEAVEFRPGNPRIVHHA